MGSRVVYKVEDLYPDVAIALSTLREKSLLAILLLKLSQFLLRRADCVVALDEAMTGRLHKAGARSIETIPNWADGTAIRPDRQSGRTFQDTEGLSGKFIVLYSGNLGLVHRFDAVVEAAKQCAIELPNVLFLFVGNGARWTEVQQASIGLSNVRFMDYLPREKLRALYNAADVHLIALCDEVAGLLFPSKYPAALAAGKPVLLVGGSGAPFREEIRKRELGRVCPHEASVIVRAIRDMAESPHKREFMGRNARRVFEARYSKAIALQRWEHVLNCVVQGEQIPTQVIEEIQGPAVFEERNACSAPPL
jgi:glycosyltransferase involved in cell wall biosynthesis